ncbi:hypothetical protein H261_22438 [Paramagnetospirillum caucaseum]|uniref:Uncharacterized protein n=1 Tax=Paramagnetospirillum caucaseum TaxID=1244869 RepID=M2ZK30_9PROT|nr:hypothetical protein [Paramagnetospirillum caucaseum]EME67652.1 hypothetical protein H261_22438 [Paramagnetospirillum caucaseum]
MLVIVAAEVFLGVPVLVRLPGVPGLLVAVVVPGAVLVPVRMAVLVQVVVGMGVGVGVAVAHVAVGMGVGVDMAVLVGVGVLVLVPAGFVVMVAAVHLPLPEL